MEFKETWVIMKSMEIEIPSVKNETRVLQVLCHCKTNELNEQGTIFEHVKLEKRINAYLALETLESLELFAKAVSKIVTNECDCGAYCYRVEVRDSYNNKVVYERSENL
jgi:hypothetical protein